METALLRVDGIEKSFADVMAVHGVSFEASRGEILGFLGPNGAGKTTSLRMILGILRQDRGSISFHLDSVTSTAPKERTGYLPEERGLYGDARALDLLVYFGELKGLSRTEARKRALDWLSRFDLSEWSGKKVEKLSKGMQQKVQFIAAVLHKPDFVVLDEPFSGLDPVNQDLLKEIIRTVRDEGAAVLLSSHQMNRVEELCDRLFLIHRGRRVLYGDLEAIKQAHGVHAVSMRFAGDGSYLRTLEGIDRLNLEEGQASFLLQAGTSPNRFVRSLPESIDVHALHVDRPPLHDIFVQTVEGGAL